MLLGEEFLVNGDCEEVVEIGVVGEVLFFVVELVMVMSFILFFKEWCCLML